MIKDRPEILKWDFFESPDLPAYEPRSTDQLRRQLKDFEKLIAALRIVESDAEAALKKANPKGDLLFTPTDFRVSVEENRSRFFDYPVGTKMFEVWPDKMEVPFKMDLIKEDGKFRIVAVYPPID